MQVTKQQIAYHLSRGERAICQRALLALYQEQQPIEQETGIHHGHDGKGFTEGDTSILCNYTWRLLGTHGAANENMGPRHLTDNQLKVCAELLPKYAAQLMRIAERKAAEAAKHNCPICGKTRKGSISSQFSLPHNAIVHTNCLRAA